MCSTNIFLRRDRCSVSKRDPIASLFIKKDSLKIVIAMNLRKKFTFNLVNLA
eukprot:UN01975